MKKMIWLLMLMLMLAGCSEPVYETMGNVEHVGQVQGGLRQVFLDMPEDASVLTGSGTDVLYICRDYTMSLQNLPAGDIGGTIRTLCGYDPAQLTVIESRCGDHKRYDWVWVAAGEEGEVLCRGAVLDDGSSHYSLCVSADAKLAGELNTDWNALFDSFCLAPKGE